MDALVQHDGDLSSAPHALGVAIYEGTEEALEAVRSWLAGGGDPNALVQTSSGRRDTLLQRCVDRDNCDVNVVRLLLENGADPRITHDGWTPLHSACMDEENVNKLEIVTLLLDSGANVNAQGGLGDSTPLILLANDGDVDTAVLLLRRGASLGLRDSDGKDAEMLAREALGSVYDVDDPRRSLPALLAAVREAGGWPAYAREPRVRLLVLRTLCATRFSGPYADLLGFGFRAKPPSHDTLLDRLFAPTFPREIFWIIASYWRADIFCYLAATEAADDDDADDGDDDDGYDDDGYDDGGRRRNPTWWWMAEENNDADSWYDDDTDYDLNDEAGDYMI